MIEELSNGLNSRIVTVTLNPVFDKSLLIPDFRPGGTFIAEESLTIAAGKGVNVSRVLKNVSIDSIVSGVLPREGKDIYHKLLESDGFTHDFISTEGVIRTNVTIVSRAHAGETHLRERGPTVRRSALDLLKKKLMTLIEDETVFVFSGSIPEGLPSSSYGDLIDVVKRYGCSVFLDTSKNALRNALSSGPLFIKPNLKEVQDALGYLPGNREELKKACTDFHALGIENVMITMGKDGVVFSRKDEIILARVEISAPVNSVGSGDAAVAGSVIGILKGFDTKSIARLACAFGGANTLVSGAGMFRYKDVERLYGRIKVLSLR
jgi:1-phosphofructokinase